MIYEGMTVPENKPASHKRVLDSGKGGVLRKRFCKGLDPFDRRAGGDDLGRAVPPLHRQGRSVLPDIRAAYDGTEWVSAFA